MRMSHLRATSWATHATGPESNEVPAPEPAGAHAYPQAQLRGIPMPKPIEVITEATRSTKHAFRQIEDRPGKAKKNRYERRKVKELMRFGDWSEEVAGY